MNRRLFALGLALPLFASAFAAEPPPPAAAGYIQPHPRTVDSRVFEVWRHAGRFTKNPDIIQLASGRLLLVYADNDRHWSQEEQYLTLLASDDRGQTWRNFGIVDHHDMRSSPRG